MLFTHNGLFSPERNALQPEKSNTIIVSTDAPFGKRNTSQTGDVDYTTRISQHSRLYK
jgi:hypothetical protein